MTMKLYMHPASNASRPVMLFCAENKIDVQQQVVDLMKGEHYSDWYTAINPNRQVPTLDDDGFILTESSAILKYLASKTNSPLYPTNDLKKRAHVDEMMDWFNTQFYRDFGYGLAYPQLFPHHKRPTDEIHEGVINWGKEKADVWFKVLDTHWLKGGKPYVCGNEITIADYLGASFVTIGEILRCDYSHLPNVSKWLGNMKKLSSWAKVNEAHYGFAGMVKDKPFKVIAP
jgi:glutathione S-transferase